jgi:CTP synthase (UTP-ammonia lyase)
MHDRKSIYTIPDDMREEGLDREILSIIGLHDRVDRCTRTGPGSGGKGTSTAAEAPRSVSAFEIGITGQVRRAARRVRLDRQDLEHCGAHLGVKIGAAVDRHDRHDRRERLGAAREPRRR